MRGIWLTFVTFLYACATAGSTRPLEAPAPNASAAAASAGVVEAASMHEPLLPNQKQPLPSVLTGGAPSEAQLRAAQVAGYKTVVSLLPEVQPEATQAQALGLRFVSIPVAGAPDLTERNARALGDAMAEAGSAPLILHCASGNRAGALLALKAFFVDHAAPEAAIQLGESAGLTSLRPAVEAVMRGDAPAP